jgi:hypothetical protein
LCASNVPFFSFTTICLLQMRHLLIHYDLNTSNATFFYLYYNLHVSNAPFSPLLQSACFKCAIFHLYYNLHFSDTPVFSFTTISVFQMCHFSFLEYYIFYCFRTVWFKCDIFLLHYNTIFMLKTWHVFSFSTNNMFEIWHFPP